VATGFELGNCGDGIELGRFGLFMTLLRRLFEPRRRNLLTELKPQSVNKKRLFAQHERRVADNLSRDDRMAIELFLAGIRGWEAGLRRRMDDGKSKQN
jgi:hypothetical protein